MSRLSVLALFLCAVLATGYVNGNLIRANDGAENEKKEVIAEAAIDNAIHDTPQEVAPKCKKIGEFCMYHSDCCSNACLGYLKRCVS